MILKDVALGRQNPREVYMRAAVKDFVKAMQLEMMFLHFEMNLIRIHN